jgi:hypothetical protein
MPEVGPAKHWGGLGDWEWPDTGECLIGTNRSPVGFANRAQFRSARALLDWPTCDLNQRCNKAQQFLLLWPITNRTEKSSELNVGRLSA